MTWIDSPNGGLYKSHEKVKDWKSKRGDDLKNLVYVYIYIYVNIDTTIIHHISSGYPYDAISRLCKTVANDSPSNGHL